MNFLCQTQDFAFEGDESNLRKAAHLMVSSLAGSLALVTCREPLRVALGNQLNVNPHSAFFLAAVIAVKFAGSPSASRSATS